METMSFFHKITSGLTRSFKGYGIFEGEKRELFYSEVLETSRTRTHFTIILILLIQVINYFWNLTSEQHAICLPCIRNGTITISIVCIVFAIFFSYIKHRKTSFSLQNILIKIFWAVILLASLFFTYANFVEEKSAAFNITLLVLAIAIIPILTFPEIISYLVPYIAINIWIGLRMNVPAFFIQQLIILALISIYISQTQFLSAVNVFIERQHLNDKNVKLEKLSETDPLTGLLNRRGLENHITEFENYYRFSRKYICVLMICVDHFKESNMLHSTGEDCLRRITECIKSCAYQSTDAIAHLSGEEFIVISDTKNEGAISLALRIKHCVEALKFPLNENPPFITVSIGAAVPGKGDIFEENISPVPELINIADRQLANAKICGRNCVSSGDIIFR